MAKGRASVLERNKDLFLGLTAFIGLLTAVVVFWDHFATPTKGPAGPAVQAPYAAPPTTRRPCDQRSSGDNSPNVCGVSAHDITFNGK